MLNGKAPGLYFTHGLERAIATNVATKVRDCGVRVYVYVWYVVSARRLGAALKRVRATSRGK